MPISEEDKAEDEGVSAQGIGAGAAEPGGYAVGFGRPPRHTRFQTGQSGNRKGRRKRVKSMATLLTMTLDERVAVTENGRRKVISKREAIIAQLVNRSAAADLKAMAMLIGLLQKVEPAAATGVPEPDGLAEADEQVVAGLLARLGADPGRVG